MMLVQQVVPFAVLDSFRTFGLGLNVARDRVQWRTWEEAAWYFCVPFPATCVVAVRRFPLCCPPDITGMFHVCNNILLKAFISPEPQGAAIQRALQRIHNTIMERRKKAVIILVKATTVIELNFFSPWNWEFSSFPVCVKRESLQFASVCIFLCSLFIPFFADNETDFVV